MNHEGVINPDGLRNWYAAVANQEQQPANVVVIGDSISEGAVAGGWTATWRYLLQDALRAAYPCPGVKTPGIGYVPALGVTNAPQPPVTTSGSPSTGFTDHGMGLKRYRVNNTQYVEWSAQTCDTIRVWYGKSNSVAGGAVVAVDGVDQTPALSSSDPTNSDGWTQVWTLSAGSHTIRVRGSSAFGFVLEAVEFFNGDYGKGIHVYDAAHYGFRTDQFLTAGADYGHWQAIATAQPRLFIWNLQANDWGTNSAATFLANVDTHLAKMATAASTRAYSVLIIGNYRPATGGDPQRWLDYQAGLRTRAVGNVSVLSIQPPWPDLYPNTSNTYMFETVAPLHPNAAGHAAMRDLIFQAIAPPRPAAPKGTYLPLTPKAVLP